MSARRPIGLWILLWVCLAVTVVCQLGALGAWQAAYGGPRGDHIAATAPRDSQTSLSPQDMQTLREALHGTPVSWWATAQLQVSTERTGMQAQVVACDGSFAAAHAVPLLRGSFLPRNGGSAAVLSADVAWQLFGTVDAVGMIVSCDGRDYEVCGVSAARDGLLGVLCGGNQPTVYLSGAELLSAGTMDVGGVDVLLETAPGGQSLQAVRNALAGLGVGGDWLLEDLGEQASLQGQLIRLPSAAWVAASAVLLLVGWVRVLRGAVIWTRQMLERRYLLQAWPALLGKAALLLAVLALCAGAVAALWSGAGLLVNLPGRYLPDSWIDLGFYGALIKSEIARWLTAWAYERPWWALQRVQADGLCAVLTTMSGVGAVLAAGSISLLHGRRAVGAARGETTGGRLAVPLLGLGLVLVIALGILALGWAGLPGTSFGGTLAVDAAALTLWMLWPRCPVFCDWLAALGGEMPYEPYTKQNYQLGGNKQ